MKRELVFTKKESEEILPFPDKDLEEAIKKKFDFEIGYMPEGFKIVILLSLDDKEDSRKDKWTLVCFKEAMDFQGQTITLDNFEQIKEGKKTYDFFKVIKDINFEETINSSVDLIKKYYDDVKNDNPI
jgi:hypothetical protein